MNWKIERREASLTATDPEGWWQADIRFDGCVQFRRAFNHPLGSPHLDPDDVDNIHLCSLDETIAILQSLREIALREFGPEAT